MSYCEVKKLLKKTGYRIKKVYPLAHLPGRLNFIFLPQIILKPVELFLTKMMIFKYLAKDWIFVVKKRQ